MERQTISVTELAKTLGIGRSTAYEAVNNGQIRAARIGRRWIVSKEELARILNRN